MSTNPTKKADKESAPVSRLISMFNAMGMAQAPTTVTQAEELAIRVAGEWPSRDLSTMANFSIRAVPNYAHMIKGPDREIAIAFIRKLADCAGAKLSRKHDFPFILGTLQKAFGLDDDEEKTKKPKRQHRAPVNTGKLAAAAG